MSEPITLAQQVRYMEKMLDTCETSYPLKVEMGRLTRGESERSLARLRAVVATLKKAEAAGGVAQSAVNELSRVSNATVMAQVRQCAEEHAHGCEHCASIANILTEAAEREQRRQ